MKFNIKSFFDTIKNVESTNEKLCEKQCEKKQLVIDKQMSLKNIKKTCFEKQIIQFIKCKFKKELEINKQIYFFDNTKLNILTFLFTNNNDVFLIQGNICNTNTSNYDKNKLIMKKYSCENVKLIMNETIMEIFKNNLYNVYSDLYRTDITFHSFSKIKLKNKHIIQVYFTKKNLTTEFLLFNLYTESYMKKHNIKQVSMNNIKPNLNPFDNIKPNPNPFDDIDQNEKNIFDNFY